MRTESIAQRPGIILVPVDGSDGSATAARYGAMLARGLDAPLRLLFAFPRDALQGYGVPPETAGAGQMNRYSPGRFEALRDERAAQVFEQMRAQIQDAAVQIEQALLTGDPAEEIVAHAGATANPLIVIGSRGLSRVSELILGSVSHRVLHRASCPVTVVRE